MGVRRKWVSGGVISRVKVVTKVRAKTDCHVLLTCLSEPDSGYEGADGDPGGDDRPDPRTPLQQGLIEKRRFRVYILAPDFL